MREVATEDAAILTSRENGRDLRFTLSGRLDAASIGEPWRRMREAIRGGSASNITIDASELLYCDSAGASMLVELGITARERGAAFEIIGFPAEFRSLLDLLQRRKPDRLREPARRESFVVEVGRKTMTILGDLQALIAFVGEIVLALVWAASHPHRIRWRDSIRTMRLAGVAAFPVVVIFLFLVGLILAYQTAGSFKQYGADLLMADMLAISVLRELGPLMAAIMMTARSSSAFAAEIGTMKVNEEVDALTTMGLDPTRFLIVPRVIAALVVVPILSVFANIAALVGGLIVWKTTLKLTTGQYLREIASAVDPSDLIGGLAKTFVFAIIIAGIGCLRGMQTRGGSVAVGISTTNAVVSGIILIVAADMIFAVFYFYLGI